jgi:hypothetical protein
MVAQGGASDLFISYYDFDFMARLHIGMTAGLPDAEFETQFAANVDFLEQLAGQLVSTVIEECAEQPAREDLCEQIQRWQADPFLAELIACYRRVEATNPIDSGWVTLGQQSRELQEVAR